MLLINFLVIIHCFHTISLLLQKIISKTCEWLSPWGVCCDYSVYTCELLPSLVSIVINGI
jgi:hypothetical protein